MAAHGHPRFTGDIDFWLSPATGNIERLLDAMKAFGFGSLGLQVSDFKPGTVIQLGGAGVKSWCAGETGKE